MTDNDTIAALLDGLTSPEPARQQAARTLLLAMQENAVPLLADAYYAGVGEAQGVALLDAAAEIGGPEAMKLLEEAFHHARVPVWRRWAALGLARNGQADVTNTFLEWLQHGDAAERQLAALGLGYVGGEAAQTALVHALHEPDVAGQAVRALAQRGSVEGLAAGYNTDDARVWQLVTDALLSLGEAGTAPLLDILQTEHEEFFDRVFVSLQNSDSAAARALLDAVE